MQFKSKLKLELKQMQVDPAVLSMVKQALDMLQSMLEARD
jgi:hypothetical protein